jgi:Flp pilus assembly pilin Flp
MIRSLRKSRGQSTLEYAILIVVVIVALIGIQAYLKRGIQGRLRDSSDQIGDQFAPEFTQYNYRTQTGGAVHEYSGGGASTTEYRNQYQTRSGAEQIGNFEEEFWQN